MKDSRSSIRQGGIGEGMGGSLGPSDKFPRSALRSLHDGVDMWASIIIEHYGVADRKKQKERISVPTKKQEKGKSLPRYDTRPNKTHLLTVYGICMYCTMYSLPYVGR